MRTHQGCSYERPLHFVDDRNRILTLIETRIGDTEFDGFAISGYSMSIIGSILADRMKKQLMVVRKVHEPRYSEHNVEGALNQRWLFVDDMIDSGRTLQHVYDGVQSLKGELLGVVLWRDGLTAKVQSKCKVTSCEGVDIVLPLLGMAPALQSTPIPMPASLNAQPVKAADNFLSQAAQAAEMFRSPADMSLLQVRLAKHAIKLQKRVELFGNALGKTTTSVTNFNIDMDALNPEMISKIKEVSHDIVGEEKRSPQGFDGTPAEGTWTPSFSDVGDTTAI